MVTIDSKIFLNVFTKNFKSHRTIAEIALNEFKCPVIIMVVHYYTE